MKDFEYVTKKEYLPVKNELIELINLVQDEVRDKFTFRFDFIGSASRNMITRDKKSNIGYDFDVNIRVNDDDNEYSAKEIRRILKDGFDKHSKKFQYDYAEDSKRVLTIKLKIERIQKYYIVVTLQLQMIIQIIKAITIRNLYILTKSKTHMNGKNNLKAFICLMRRLVGLKKMTYGKKYEIHILKERIVTIIQTKNQDLSSQKQLLLFLMTMVAFKMIIMMTTNMMINDEGGKRYV